MVESRGIEGEELSFLQEYKIVFGEAEEGFLDAATAGAAVVGHAIAAEGGNVKGGEAVERVARVVAEGA